MSVNKILFYPSPEIIFFSFKPSNNRCTMNQSSRIKTLQQRIEELEKENALLRKDFSSLSGGDSVKVPDAMKPVFDIAQHTVNEYFRNLKMDPSRGTIEINDQRYVL